MAAEDSKVIGEDGPNGKQYEISDRQRHHHHGGKSSGRHQLSAKGSAKKKYKTLEEELEALTVELATVRQEREKQRQQLEQLTQEQAALESQVETRRKRTKLVKQLEDLEITVDQKLHDKQHATEELEGAKTHYRQLKRTYHLLRGGVEDIIDQSKEAHDNISDRVTEEEHANAVHRDQILERVLRRNQFYQQQERLFAAGHISSLSAMFGSSLGSVRAEEDEVSEAEEIDEYQDEVVGFFGNKNRNTPQPSSNPSMISGQSEYTSRSNRSRSGRSDRTKSGSDRTRDRRERSRSRGSRDRSHRSHDRTSRSRDRSSRSLDRSSRSKSHGGRSQSESRTTGSSEQSRSHSAKRGKRSRSRRHTQQTPDPGSGSIHTESNHRSKHKSSSDESEPGKPIKKPTPLMAMLANDEKDSEGDDDDDTPKTTNTRD